MTDAERYAISVKKALVDGEEFWRATVRELPDLAEFAETREEAIDLALDAIETLKAAAVEEERPFPEPISDDEEYSGRVTLRLAKPLHRAVAMRALADDVSLNTYISNALMASVVAHTGFATASGAAISNEGAGTYPVGTPGAPGFGLVAVTPMDQREMGYWSVQTISAGAPGVRYWDLSGGNTVAALGASINVEAPHGDAVRMFGSIQGETPVPLALVDRSERRRRA